MFFHNIRFTILKNTLLRLLAQAVNSFIKQLPLGLFNGKKGGS